MALFTTNKSSPWPTIILVLLTAGLTLLLTNMVTTCNRATPTGQAPDSVMYWRNEANKGVASLRGAIQDFGVQSKKLTDSIARVYGSKFNQLREYVIATMETRADVPFEQGSTERDYMPIDSERPDCPPETRNIRGSFQSPYYHADAQLGEDPYLKVIGFDTLTVVWKDTTIGRFLNRKKYLQLDISLANPDTKISGIKSYRVPPPLPKKWAIGLQFGFSGYFDVRRQRLGFAPTIGVGVTKTLIRF